MDFPSLAQEAAAVQHPDRVDFRFLADGRTVVNKLQRHYRHDVVLDQTIHNDLDRDTALDWLRANGYTVHTWSTGARAWYGEAWVIRWRSRILRLRKKLERELARTGSEPRLFLDLRYDG